MAASRSLNEPVVMVTLIGAGAAPAVCIAMAINRTKEMAKHESFVLIVPSDNVLVSNGPEVNEIVQRRQARAVADHLFASFMPLSEM
jgi:hypothetical protein